VQVNASILWANVTARPPQLSLCFFSGFFKISGWSVEGVPPIFRAHYFVFASSIVLLAATVAAILSVQLQWSHDKVLVLLVSGIGISVCVVNGALEAWSARTLWPVGTTSELLPVYDQSWIAAAAFYFCCVILYGVDYRLTKNRGT